MVQPRLPEPARSALALLLVGDQPNLVDAFFPHRIDDLYHLAITNVDAALDVDDLVFFFLVRERLFDRRLQVVEISLASCPGNTRRLSGSK